MQILEELEISNKESKDSLKCIHEDETKFANNNDINNNDNDENTGNNDINNANSNNENHIVDNSNKKENNKTTKVRKTIEDRMLELEDKLNDILRKPSYAKAAKNINTTSDSGIELNAEKEEDINEQENEENTSCNIIIHSVEESLNVDPRELNYEDQKYVENVII